MKSLEMLSWYTINAITILRSECSSYFGHDVWAARRVCKLFPPFSSRELHAFSWHRADYVCSNFMISFTNGSEYILKISRAVSTLLGISFNYVVFVANWCVVTFPEYVNMTQFMKKYMIQTLYMDAWDLGTFYIGDQLFLGVSQLGGKSFVIYKWDSQHR